MTMRRALGSAPPVSAPASSSSWCLEFITVWWRAPRMPERESPWSLPENRRVDVAPMGEAALDHLGRKHVGRKAAELRGDRGGERRHVRPRRQVAGIAENLLACLRQGEI